MFSGPLLAINKPYGLQIKSLPKRPNSTDKKKIVQTLNTVLCSNYKGDLTQLLPYIAKELGYDTLQAIKSPER